MEFQADSIRKNYGHRNILNDIFLSLSPGQLTALFGRNGEGKTTLFKVLIGLERPEYQFLRYGDKKLSSFTDVVQVINFLPQQHFLPANIVINKLVKAYLSSSAYIEFHNHDIFRKFQKAKPVDLSGGERRLLEILILMYAEAPILILDEPFRNLEPKYVQLIQETIINFRTKKSILLTDHNYRAVLDIADRYLLLSNGHLKELSSISDLVNLNYLPQSALEFNKENS